MYKSENKPLLSMNLIFPPIYPALSSRRISSGIGFGVLTEGLEEPSCEEIFAILLLDG